IRAAKRRGLPVTCEATPHHLTLTDEACLTYDTSTKTNPPLRSAKDVAALRKATIEALLATKDFKGVLGTWSFDGNGDTSNTLFSGSQVTGGAFTFVKVLGG
ncbi:MAG: hypothetical protein AAB131_17185, partial [Actinomycetota bacterium]